MVAAIGAVAGVAGAAISSSGAQSAADTQSQASQQASMLQAQQAAQMRQDLSPWTSSGGQAQSALNRYLGLGGVGSSGVTSMGLSTGLTPDQVRQQLLSQYTKSTTSTGSGGQSDYYTQLRNSGYDDQSARVLADQYAKTGIGSTSVGPNGQPIYGNGMSNFGVAGQQGGGQGSNSQVDEEGLNAAIAKYYAEQDAQNKGAAADPAYGSLLRPYRNGEEFSFTGKDLATDPGYQFGLNQGTQGVERGQAARGNFLSGAAMKELDRFNQDYAGTKFDNAFNRASSTWNTNLNAYDNNRSRIYSFLTGVSTLGQNSAAQVGTNNQQAASAIGNNVMSGAAAQSAGQIAGGNALQSGINNGVNTYNWNNMLSNGGGGKGLSSYDYGFNGQSNPANQSALTNEMNKYVG
jgi:hypothetical protein